MSRRFVGFAVVVAAFALISGITFDLDTMSLRHLTSLQTKQTFGILAVAIIILMVLAGKFPGSGPQPPRLP